LGQRAATKVSEEATVIGEEGIATLVSEPFEDEADESAQAELDDDALAGLESYRARFRVEWEPEQGEPEVLTFEEARTRDPSARRLVMGGMVGEQSVEIVQIADQSWVCAEGTCSQMQADPDELASSFSGAAMFDPSDVTNDANASFVGREKVHGIQTRHYTLDLTPLQVAFMAQGDVSDVNGDAWVADEPDLPSFAVRFEMSWKEKRQELVGQVSFIYEIYDVNAPFTIEPPEGADEGGLPDDVPVYPNGVQTFSSAGMTTFKSPDDLTSVADFYREALVAAGWTMESDDEIEAMVNQVWKKGGRTLTLVASREDGGTTVMIAIEGGS
jgi:hypothetical protein